ncbi:hypothetical protein OAK19_06130, partial [Aureispira]|nr:hypothetical protein [Aureispira sp.]
EEKYLSSEKGQVYIASAMYRALKEYKIALEGKTSDQYKAASKLLVKKIDSIQQSEQKTTFVPTANSNKKTESLKKNKSSSLDVPDNNETYPANSEPQNTTSKIIYRVQLASLSSKVDLNNKTWSTIDGVECLKVGDSYKCLVGKYYSLDLAAKSQKYWRNNGFEGAFVVVFNNGKKINVSEVND